MVPCCFPALFPHPVIQKYIRERIHEIFTKSKNWPTKSRRQKKWHRQNGPQKKNDGPDKQKQVSRQNVHLSRRQCPDKILSGRRMHCDLTGMAPPETICRTFCRTVCRDTLPDILSRQSVAASGASSRWLQRLGLCWPPIRRHC